MAHTLGVGPTTGSNTGTTENLTLVGTTIGRSIAILVWWCHATAVVSSITISGESNATLIGTPERRDLTSGALYALQVAYLSNNTAGGDKTITATFDASTAACGLCAVEIAGGDTAGWYDGAEAGAQAGTVNITTNTANAFVIGVCADNGGGPTAGSGYTAIVLPNVFWFEEGQYDLDVGAAGSKTFDMGVSGTAVIKCAAFKIAGGAPASILRQIMNYEAG